MSGFVHLNGRIVPISEAAISPLDRGFLFGDGLFETMRIYDRGIHLLRRHLERLRSGAATIELRIPDDDLLTAALRETADANAMANGALRLTVSRGVGMLGRADEGEPTILVTARPLAQAGDFRERMIVLEARRGRASTPVGLKSLAYFASVHGALELTRRGGAAEGIMLSEEGFVVEGSVSNIFCVSDEVLLTPPIDLGILPGITRGRVIELARSLGMEVREERFTLEALRSARECFYTNSLREIVPATSIDEIAVGSGSIGPITSALAEAYHREAPDEQL